MASLSGTKGYSYRNVKQVKQYLQVKPAAAQLKNEH